MIRTIQRTTRATLAAIPMLALAAASAAHADPHWQALPGVPIHGSPTAVAMSENQAITLAATPSIYEGGGVSVTTRGPDGAWSAPVHLGSATWASTVRVAANARGDVVVGWDQDGSQHIAVRPAGQAFLPVVDLPDSTDSGNIDGVTPQVGVNDAGEVTTAWLAKTNAADTQLPIPESIRFTSGSLSAPVQTVHAADAGPVFQLRTAHQGPSALAFNGAGGVQAVVRRAGEDFGAVQPMTAPGTSRAPKVAVTADGRAAVAFEAMDGGQRIALSRTDANGVFEPATLVSSAGVDAFDPALAWSAGSGIQLAWRGTAAGTDQGVTAVAPADGPLGVLAEHDQDGTSVAEINVLAAADGQAKTFFVQSHGELRSVHATASDPAQTSSVHAINEQPAIWPYLTVAGDDAGDAAVAWRAQDTAWMPTLSVWDVTPPAVTVTAPATATAGQPFAVKVGATDALTGVASRAVTIGDAAGAPVAGPALGADGTATATLAQPGTYTVTGRATDNNDNAGTAARTITVVAAPKTPAAPVAPKATCKVPSLRNHSVAYAKRLLATGRCKLGRVTTPKRYKHTKGLVIRSQSRPAGQKPVAGAHVSVTLGVKPKPKTPKHKHKTTKHKH